MNRESVIKALEEYAKEALVQLESYKQVERDYRQAVRSLRIFKGEVTALGRKPGVKRKPGGVSGAGAAVYLLLKGNPKGLTVREMATQLKLPTNTVHSSLKAMRDRGETLKMNRTGSGSAKTYSLGPMK